VKRSEAIGGIVQSISVIPNPILRSTYLTDLSMRVGMKEQTLLNTMNQFIRRNLEEKRKEQERERLASAAQGIAESGAPVSQPQVPVTETVMRVNQPQVQSAVAVSPLETLLVSEVVRHGEEIIYDNIETDDGQTINLTVAQYIDYDMGQDQLQFSHPLYRQILDEAVSHSGEAGFRAEPYFTAHPDITVSQLATRLAVDRHQLGGRFALSPKENSLRQRIVHLMMDYRMELMNQRLKDIQSAMRKASSDMDHVMQLMKEYRDTEEMRDALAKRLGRDVVS
jgi:DNA primase